MVSVYASNIGAQKYMNQILTNLKAEIHRNTIIRDFNILLSTTGRSSRQKFNKKTLDWNYTLDQMDIYKT